MGGDLIIGDNHLSAIGTLVERKTRMVRLVHLLRSDDGSLRTALVARIQDLPPELMWSITWDQGTEMARHLATADKLGAPVYFCDSRSPWQRGTNDYYARVFSLAGHTEVICVPSSTSSTTARACCSKIDVPQIYSPRCYLRRSVGVATLTRTHPGTTCSVLDRS